MSQYGLMCDLKINVGHFDLYFMVLWFCLISWRLFDIWTSYFGITSQYDPTFDLKINVGHCDLYFMVQWFCLISWRLFNIWSPYFGIMSQYDPMFDLKINVGHWPLFYGPVILPYILKIIWYMNTILWDFESVWPDVQPKNNCRSLWPIFHSPVILPYILKTIWYMNFIRWDYESVWPDVWPKINVGHCDLYFMVQWFCLISWKELNFILWDYESVWPDVRPQNIYMSVWPIFHGPVILPYTLKMVWALNIIFCDNESV